MRGLALAFCLGVASSLWSGVAESAQPAKRKAKEAKSASAGSVDQGEDPEESIGAKKDKTSAGAGSGKKFGVAMLYTPVSDFVLQYGAGGHYHFSPTLQVGAQFLRGSKDKADDFDESNNSTESTVHVTKADFVGAAAWGYARYFVGRTFNVLGGIGLRRATADMRIDDAARGDFFETSLVVSSVIVPVAVGNQWRFPGGFVIGCDWIAALLPLSGSATSESSSNVADPVVEDLFDEFQALGEDLAKSTSLTLALTTIGWEF